MNSVGFLPHQMLRSWVMGDDAWERVATEAERDRMAAVLDGALAPGALGLSTSVMDTDRSNRLAPSRLADDAEFGALAAVLARHGAVLQFVPRILQPEHFLDDVERAGRIVAPLGVPMLFAGYPLEAEMAGRRADLLAYLDRRWADGAPLWVTYSVRPSHVNMHFERSIMWSGVPALARAGQHHPGAPAGACWPTRRGGPAPGPTGTPAPTRSPRSASPTGCSSSAGRTRASRSPTPSPARAGTTPTPWPTGC